MITDFMREWPAHAGSPGYPDILVLPISNRKDYE